jgi:hypothetical protein
MAKYATAIALYSLQDYLFPPQIVNKICFLPVSHNITRFNNKYSILTEYVDAHRWLSPNDRFTGLTSGSLETGVCLFLAGLSHSFVKIGSKKER